MSRAGDGDDAAVMLAMVEWAQKHEVDQFGGAAVFPVPDVVSVQATGGSAAGNRAAAVTMFQGATEPTADGAGDPAGADHLTVAFEPDFAGGITGEVLALGLAQ